MALSHSSVALPTKAALICSEPAAALRLGRELVSHGLGGAKRIGTDLPALGGASDAASPTTSTEEDLPWPPPMMTAMTELAFLERSEGPAAEFVFFGSLFLAIPTRKSAIPRCEWPSPGLNPPSPRVSGHPHV